MKLEAVLAVAEAQSHDGAYRFVRSRQAPRLFSAVDIATLGSMQPEVASCVHCVVRVLASQTGM